MSAHPMWPRNLAILLALTIIGCGSGDEGSTSSGELVYVDHVADELVKIRADGSGRSVLADSLNQPTYPTPSPDGNTVLFRQGPQWYLIPASGGTALAISAPQDGGVPRWSPDASRLGWVTCMPMPCHIELATPHRTYAIKIYPDGGVQPPLSWAPDGQSVLFSGIPAPGEDADIFVATLDSNYQLLLGGDASDYAPSYSPSGDRIAFVRTGTAEDGLWLMNPDGTSPRPLMTEFVPEPDFWWSPDGRRILALVGIQAVVIDALTGQVTTLPGYSAPVPLTIGSPWAADGRSLLGIGYSGAARPTIMTYTVAGESRSQVLPDSAYGRYPAWLPQHLE